MNRATELLAQLISQINREDGYYVLTGVSRETGNDATFEVSGVIEETLDDIIQLLIDEGIIVE